MKKKKSSESRHIETLSIKEFMDSYVYRIDFDADYQREVIWSRKQQLELLDSVIKDIDIPKLYLVEVNDSDQYDYECIDGKQRMTSILNFFKPNSDEQNPLTVEVTGKQFTYKQLKKVHPSIVNQIERYKLTFVIYREFGDPDFVRQIFRRLQLGVRLNTGELLKTQTGSIRDFIYKEIGDNGPFLRNTNLSLNRFSRPFTLAQICINSFSKAKSDKFTRARYEDLKDFFEEYHELNKNDENFSRIRNVLKKMDSSFGTDAMKISSRAVAVSAYLFSEDLYLNNKENLVDEFARFFIKFLHEIKQNMDLLAKMERPHNKFIIEEFQKYVLQASVEGYSIERRHKFLSKAFSYYLSSRTSKKIISGE